jgi:hypothetical protein
MHEIKQIISYMDGLGYKKGLIIHSYDKGEIREYHVEGRKIYCFPLELIKNELYSKKVKLIIKEYSREKYKKGEI